MFWGGFGFDMSTSLFIIKAEILLNKIILKTPSRNIYGSDKNAKITKK